MTTGTVIFVHGTGVRLKGYQVTFESARRLAASCGIEQQFVPCAWGDPLGVEFEGKSLPDSPSAAEEESEEEDFARWAWLIDDPLSELDMLTIRDTSAVGRPIDKPGHRPAWRILWDTISRYTPSPELRLLLERSALSPLWEAAWNYVIGSPVSREAFDASAHELADAAHALARATVAQLHSLAVGASQPGPSRGLRDRLVQRLIADWGQDVYGLGTFLSNRIRRAATRVLKAHRN